MDGCSPVLPLPFAINKVIDSLQHLATTKVYNKSRVIAIHHSFKAVNMKGAADPATSTATSQHAPDASDETTTTTTIPVFESEESRDLISANFTHFRQDPFSFLKQVSLHYSGAGWRGYNDFIGQPIFYKGFSEQMKGKVMRSAIVQKKIVELAERRANIEAEEGRFGGADEGERLRAKEKRREEVERQLVEVAEGIIDGMICKFESKRFIRVCLPMNFVRRRNFMS